MTTLCAGCGSEEGTCFCREDEARRAAEVRAHLTAAKWFDDELAIASTWRGKLTGVAAINHEGQLAVLAEAGPILRQMAAGLTVQHRPGAIRGGKR